VYFKLKLNNFYDFSDLNLFLHLEVVWTNKQHILHDNFAAEEII
jgi:hypothetical protein